MYDIRQRNKALRLRSKGYSYSQISQTLNISKDTAFVWTKDIDLSVTAKARLQKRINDSYERSKKAQLLSREQKIAIIHKDEEKVLEEVSFTHSTQRLLCAMLYWCEGSKDPERVAFTNSDPQVIKTFLTLFRQSFHPIEGKFRVVMHLHDYDDEGTQKLFWSRVTQIEEYQFSKTYRKSHSGKVKRQDYAGCVCIRYYDTVVAQRLLILAKEYMKLF